MRLKVIRKIDGNRRRRPLWSSMSVHHGRPLIEASQSGNDLTAATTWETGQAPHRQEVDAEACCDARPKDGLYDCLRRSRHAVTLPSLFPFLCPSSCPSCSSWCIALTLQGIRSLSGTDLSTAAIPSECREDACPSLTFDCIRSLSGTDLSTAAIPSECREDACPSLTFDCLTRGRLASQQGSPDAVRCLF
jgi:hypothetical protein